MSEKDKQTELLRRVRKIQVYTAHLIRDILAGQYESTFKGRGMAFSEVREYVPGDDVRSIDWNVTARMNAPYVKQFVEERELTILLLVDLSGSQDFGSGNRTKRDVAAELAAILAFSAIQNNDRVGLILFTDQIESYIPPCKGATHALRIIRDLLFFHPQSRGTSIRSALDFLNSVSKRKSVVFLISDFIAGDVREAFPVTARRHDLIPVRIIDPLERQLPDIGLVEMEDMETGDTVLLDTSSRTANARLADVFRRSEDQLEGLFRSMRSTGLALQTTGDLVNPLRSFFRMRRRSR